LNEPWDSSCEIRMSQMVRLIREAEIASGLVFRNRLALARDSVRETGYTWKCRGVPGGSSPIRKLPTKRGSRKCAKDGDQCPTRYKDFWRVKGNAMIRGQYIAEAFFAMRQEVAATGASGHKPRSRRSVEESFQSYDRSIGNKCWAASVRTAQKRSMTP
jgi:hypothetical protein